ncbi:MAG TPA: Flp family type IVb pilin [Novosphingobium sp.]|nr:Flp family type IVb pilin [Novosphingobium sp.]
MKAILTRLVSDQRGTSAIEYGLICAMIVLAMLTALKGVADENNGIWAVFSSKTNEAISKANGG